MRIFYMSLGIPFMLNFIVTGVLLVFFLFKREVNTGAPLN